MWKTFHLQLSYLQCQYQPLIPSDIGGRFSVFTAVGLLPIACAGFDVTQLIKGSIILGFKYLGKSFIFISAGIFSVTSLDNFNKKGLSDVV